MRHQSLFRRLLLLWLLALAACATQTSAPAPPPANRVVLRLWHAWPAAEGRAIQTLVERFNRSHPEWQLVVQTRPAVSLPTDLITAVNEGGGPHLVIVQSHTLGALAQVGVIRSLEGFIPTGDIDNLLPTAVGAAQMTINGQQVLFGIPISFDTLALYYNRANVLQPPADTDTLLLTARALTDTGRAPPVWGLAYNLALDRTLCYLYAFGGRMFDENGAVALGDSGRSGTERWLAWLSELYRDDQLLATLDGIVVDRALLAREALMTIDWAHAQASYRAIWGDQLGVAPLPRLSAADRPPQPYVQADVIALNARLSDPAEQAAAQAFIRFMLDPASQRELLAAGRQPVQLALRLTDSDLNDPVQLAAARIFRAQAQNGLPMPADRTTNELIWTVLADMQLSVIRGLLPPDQAVTIADATLRARLAVPGE